MSQIDHPIELPNNKIIPPYISEPLILASQSPRRKELLGLCGIPFSVYVSEVDEYLDFSVSLEKAVESLAFQKASAVQALYPKKVILGADTIVTLDDKILGKPKNKEDAFSMLTILSGRSHEVITSVCILSDEKKIFLSQRSRVYFFPISPDDIASYIATGEPMDKAGAYGIQGKGAIFIQKIDGDFYSVMGLPVSLVYRELRKIFGE